jgi:hypothetical protein
MPKPYPRRTLYISDAEWEMVNWLAGKLRTEKRKSVSVSEVVRDLIVEAYQAQGGPNSEAS